MEATGAADVAGHSGVLLLWLDVVDVSQLAADLLSEPVRAGTREVGAVFVSGFFCRRGRRLSGWGDQRRHPEAYRRSAQGQMSFRDAGVRRIVRVAPAHLH